MRDRYRRERVATPEPGHSDEGYATRGDRDPITCPWVAFVAGAVLRMNGRSATVR